MDAGDSTLDVDTLTTTLIQAVGNRLHAHNRVGAYWSDRLRVESALLGVPELPELLAQEGGGTRREIGASLSHRYPPGPPGLLRTAVLLAGDQTTVFSSFLEAPEEIVKLYQQYGRELQRLMEAYAGAHRRLVHDCLIAIWPELADRSVSASTLEDSVPLRPPTLTEEEWLAQYG